jgi:ATP-dependent DNA ligase
MATLHFTNSRLVYPIMTRRRNVPTTLKTEGSEMHGVGTTIAPMEALLVRCPPVGGDWRYEPKWDGFRCLAFRRGKTVLLRSKSGTPLERYFPDIVHVAQHLTATRFVVDGELLMRGAEGYSFSDLQMRLHPAASRIHMLAEKQPATFVLFDILETPGGQNLMSAPLEQRRKILEDFYRDFCRSHKTLVLSPQTESLKEATAWLQSPEWHIDGLVAKKSTDIYKPGQRVMQKFKPIRTADCVVGGFRYGTNSREVGSLLLGLYDTDGTLHHVGFSSSIPKADRKALTQKLEELIQEPGFTGKAPGAPSRWSTKRTAEWEPLRPALVVEVAFDQVSDHRFRHGTRLLRFRPDKSARQCNMEQLDP